MHIESDATVCTGRDSRDHLARQAARAQLKCVPQIIELTDIHSTGVAVDVAGSALCVRVMYVVPSMLLTIQTT